MARPDVYLIGLPARDHPGGLRYWGFTRYLRTEFIEPPLRSRFFRSYWGWRFDNLLTALSRRPYYTWGLLLMECRAALHMLVRRKRLYHAIKGDVELSFLPRLCRLTGNRLVASFHEPPESLTFWKIDRSITDHLAAVILLGECQRRHFEELVPPERIFVVPHGLDTDFFHPPAERPEEPVCITVGSHLRDAATLTEAMNRVWAVEPRVRFIVVGARREHDPNPAPQIEDARVEFHDHIGDDELLRLYHRASVAVLSLTDAVANNALLEAMGCGLPVVASRVGSIPEYLGDRGGILCPPADPQALADGIVRIVTDPDLGRDMGAAARERSLEFDHRRTAERLEEIYRNVRAGNGRVNHDMEVMP